MRSIYRFFISMNTAFWLMALVMALALAGSLHLPAKLAFFSGIDDAPLFVWLRAEGGEPLATWWIYGLVAALGLLTLSTVLCTVEDFIKKGLPPRNLIRRLSPQVVHLGVCLALLGYLLTSAYGTREDLLLARGQESALSDSVVLSVTDVKVGPGEGGYMTDWEAGVRLKVGGVAGETRRLRPARPVYGGGYGLYLKSVTLGSATLGDEAQVLIRVTRDPGVLWAFIGGALVLLGSAGLALTRPGGTVGLGGPGGPVAAVD